jgi:6-phosphogluconate dehydrogenase
VKIAISGLGKMGIQMAKMLSDANYEIICHDIDWNQCKKAALEGLTAYNNPSDVTKAFGTEQIIIWLMIPANHVDESLKTWLSILDIGDIIIDGGNSDYRQTILHSQQAAALQINFMDVGTSGGILGIDNGFSMMIGGDRETFKLIEPILHTLSLPNGGYKYIGISGSGHFVKMVHNAIEYGVMESLAEGYHLLKEGPYQGINLENVASLWQKGSIISSTLNGLIADIFKENPELKGIDGFVAESGEAQWALESAKTFRIDMPVILEAHHVRVETKAGKVNFGTKLLAALRNKFGGHQINKS